MEIVNQSDRFLQMLKSFERGWEIDEPVIVGAMWRAGSEANSEVYHFVLRNKGEDRITLWSFSTSPQLLAFLSENSIQVSSPASLY